MARDKRFAEVKKLLESHGWTLTRINGSHHIFTKPGRPNVIIPVHRGKVKPAYARQAQKIIEEHGQDD